VPCAGVGIGWDAAPSSTLLLSIMAARASPPMRRLPKMLNQKVTSARNFRCEVAIGKKVIPLYQLVNNRTVEDHA
jgi:hypothetical protein